MSMEISMASDKEETYHDLDYKKWLKQKEACNIKINMKGYVMCGITSRECEKDNCFGRRWLRWI